MALAVASAFAADPIKIGSVLSVTGPAGSLGDPELKTLLRAVKAIGAQNVGEGGRNGMLGKDAWARIQAAYEVFRTPAGLPASYDVLLYTARRPA